METKILETEVVYDIPMKEGRAGGPSVRDTINLRSEISAAISKSANANITFRRCINPKRNFSIRSDFWKWLERSLHVSELLDRARITISPVKQVESKGRSYNSAHTSETTPWESESSEL
jgi:hypothetical protein